MIGLLAAFLCLEFIFYSFENGIQIITSNSIVFGLRFISKMLLINKL